MVRVGENNEPNIISLLPDISSPQEAGKTITWTANVSDLENDPVQYAFFLDGQPSRGWTNNPGWTWTTSSEDIGSHKIEVRAKDGKHDQWGDTSKSEEFIINAVQSGAFSKAAGSSVEEPLPEAAISQPGGTILMEEDGTTQAAMQSQIETSPRSERISGIGSVKKDYYIKIKQMIMQKYP